MCINNISCCSDSIVIPFLFLFVIFRQCMCCYRDIKNFERFQLVVQSMICLSLVQLKNMEKLVVDHNNRISSHPSPSTSLTQNPFTASKSNRVNELSKFLLKILAFLLVSTDFEMIFFNEKKKKLFLLSSLNSLRCLRRHHI